MSQDPQPIGFYVPRVLNGQERKVREYIEVAKSNGTLGSYVRRVLIPTEQMVSQRNGKKVIKERPYMPGYVLVEAVLVRDTEHMLCTIPNVVGSLTFRMSDGQLVPEPLRTQEVQDLLGQVDRDTEGAGCFDIEYSVGEPVRIINGPLSDFSATIDEVKSDKRKLKVMVKIFGGKASLELDYTRVEKEQEVVTDRACRLIVACDRCSANTLGQRGDAVQLPTLKTYSLHPPSQGCYPRCSDDPVCICL